MGVVWSDKKSVPESSGAVAVREDWVIGRVRAVVAGNCTVYFIKCGQEKFLDVMGL